MIYKDDELDEETKSYLNSASAQDEDAILSSPKGSTSSKSPENPPESSTNATSAPAQKKVVLKRKLLPSISLTESETPSASSTESKVIKMSENQSVSGGESETKTSNGDSDGSVVKLSQLTMKERLELRAKKFGAPISGDVAKIARAERFGTAKNDAPSSTSSTSSSSITAQKTAPDVELLKKRAERFGVSVSNTMVKMEQKEKLLKRQERFGGTTTISGTVKATTETPVTTEVASDYAEKAKLRLERFKTTA